MSFPAQKTTTSVIWAPYHETPKSDDSSPTHFLNETHGRWPAPTEIHNAHIIGQIFAGTPLLWFLGAPNLGLEQLVAKVSVTSETFAETRPQDASLQKALRHPSVFILFAFFVPERKMKE